MLRADTGRDTAVLAEPPNATSVSWSLERSVTSSSQHSPKSTLTSGGPLSRPWIINGPVTRPGGDVKVSAVCEVSVLRVCHLPEGTRVISRREKLHPGDQVRIWDDIWRYQVVYTNLPGDCIELEHRHRCRARCEQQIAILKDTGGDHSHLKSFRGNANWFGVCLLTHTLLSRLAHAAFTGTMAKARPKTLRYHILATPRPHHPARTPSHPVPPRAWSWSADILNTYHGLGIP